MPSPTSSPAIERRQGLRRAKISIQPMFVPNPSLLASSMESTTVKHCFDPIDIGFHVNASPLASLRFVTEDGGYLWSRIRAERRLW